MYFRSPPVDIITAASNTVSVINNSKLKDKYTFKTDQHKSTFDENIAGTVITDGKGGMKVWIKPELDPRLVKGVDIHEKVHIEQIESQAISLDFLKDAPEGLMIISPDIPARQIHLNEVEGYRAEARYHLNNLKDNKHSSEDAFYIKYYLEHLKEVVPARYPLAFKKTSGS